METTETTTKSEEATAPVKTKTAGLGLFFKPKGRKAAKKSPSAKPTAAKAVKAGGKRSPKAAAAKHATKKATAPRQANTARQGRKEAVIALISRKNGASLPEIMKATGWQAHSVRGLISTLGSKGGMKITSSKNAAGERTYHA